MWFPTREDAEPGVGAVTTNPGNVTTDNHAIVRLPVKAWFLVFQVLLRVS